MNRKILGSVLAIVAVLALSASTLAAFTDSNNATTSLETGSLDLELGEAGTASIIVEGVQPGYNAVRTINLNNVGSLDGEVTAAIVVLADQEVGPDCVQPEKLAGDGTCTPGGAGELSDQVTVTLAAGSARAVDDTSSVALGTIAGGGTLAVDVRTQLPTRTDNNLVQTDRLVFDVIFTLTGSGSTGETVATLPEGVYLNRDASTSTPYEFDTTTFNEGTGSIHVLPIGPNPADKFIAEFYIKTPVAEVTSFSYDFLVEAASVTDTDQFYLNVYTLAPGSTSAYYDCKFDYVPNDVANLTDWNTATFTPTDVPTRVQKWSSSPYGSSCPSTLAGMPAGSTVFFLALNVGDTNDNDEFVSGYLDNVVVGTTSGTQAFSLDPS